MYFKLFKNKDFTLLTLASLISMTGTIIQDVAFSLYVLDITKSGTKFASVLALAALPQLILGPFCGVFADRFNRKKLLVFLNIIRGLIIFVPILLLNNESISLSAIYVIVIFLGCSSALYSPTNAGTIRIIMKEEHLADAIALKTIVDSIAYLGAPILGASVYSLFGIKFIIILNGISFIIAGLVQYFVNIPDINRCKGKLNLLNFKTDFIEGISYLYMQKKIWTLTISILIFNLFSIPLFTVGNGYLAKITFHATNVEFSLLETGSVIATFFGPVLFSLIKDRFSLEEIFERVILISAIIVAVIAVISCNFINNDKISFYIFLGIFFILCSIEVPLNIVIMTILQKSIDVKLSGRINGVISTLFMGLSPIGQICYGFLFQHVYIAIPYIISSLAYIMVVFIYKKNIKKIVEKESIEIKSF